MAISEELMEKLRAVPPLPPAIGQLGKLTQDPDVEIDDVVRLIELDPNLTANLLKLVNSASMATRDAITSIRQTVVHLGMKNTYQLAMSSFLASMASQPGQGHPVERGKLLAHSIAVASCVEIMAEELNAKAAPHLYTAAILIDIGKNVLAPWMAAEPGDDAPSLTTEEKLAGADHAETGAALLELWDLPERIVSVVRYHHDPSKAPHRDITLDLVHLADCLVVESGMSPGGGEHAECPANEETQERYPMTPAQKERIAGDLRLRMEAIRDQIEFMTGGGSF